MFSSADSAAVQQAINTAQPGDKVKVAGKCVGVQYHEYMDQVAYVTQTLTVEGGYTTTNWLVSDPVQNPTVLDANLEDRVIFATAPLTVANLTIQNGYAAAPSGLSEPINAFVIFENGGGIATDHDVWVDNVDVLTNTAQYGGGVYAGDEIWLNRTDPVPTHNVWVRNSLFRNNAGTGPDVDNDVRYGGGGIYVDGSLTAIDADFIKNGTMGDGGALSIRGVATVTGGRFDSNTTDNNTIGSGAAVAITGTLSISGATVIKNVGGQTGGAVIADGDLTIINSLFQENESAEQSAGAARTYGNGVILNSQFYSNTSYTKYPVYIDGVATIVGAEFVNNLAETDYAGALYVSGQANIEGAVSSATPLLRTPALFSSTVRPLSRIQTSSAIPPRPAISAPSMPTWLASKVASFRAIAPATTPALSMRRTPPRWWIRTLSATRLPAKRARCMSTMGWTPSTRFHRQHQQR
ncbi:MAG: hypothetical protein IPK16_20765 [Anaerolineales bacterium]|nr:hypothetical protein [Anaerolineales bacterium]